jgi:cyclopropane-fatty-acyl-phospholipid synthase
MRTTANQLGTDLLASAGIQVDGDKPWDLRIHDARFFDRVLRDRELGLGEAYQQGWWDAECVDEFLAKVMLADVQREIRPRLRLAAHYARARLVNRQTVRGARQNASAHYEIGNDLFERMLDKRMVYSCAYWRDADSLEAAQEAKLELICQKLGIEPGMTVLDIGCGWGGFAAYVAEQRGARVTAISPALAQVNLARERCDGLTVDVRQLDYRQLTGKFDRIVSIGMIEHVGPKNLRRLFSSCDDLLEPDGVMLHHTIGSNEAKYTTDAWFDKYIFPGGSIPSLNQLAGAAHGDWVVEDVHNLGPDYDRTLHSWYRNIESRWTEIPHYSERFRRTWRYYLLASSAAFRVRNLQVWQIVFRRSRKPSSTYVATR